MRSGEPAGENGRGSLIHALLIVLFTVLSIPLPGLAHLRTGRRVTGLLLLGPWIGFLAFAGAAVLIKGPQAVTTLLGGPWLNVIMGIFIVGGIAWFALVLRSFAIQIPDRLSARAQIASGTFVGVAAVAAMTLFAAGAYVTIETQAAINDIFPTHGTAEPVNHSDPWKGRDRVNYLLIGGDAAKNRDGVRTDTMVVASVDVKSGNSVLLSLPRNLENVRFPPSSPMHTQFPDGYQRGPESDALLNSVWEYAQKHPQLFGASPKESKGHALKRGAETLKETIGYTLGLEIDSYALVDMWGFAEIIDAIGGLKVKVEKDITYGRYNEGRIKKGTRKLNGEQVQWYARSRTFSTDYDRMSRQRCVLNGILNQADPGTLLANFNDIAKAAKRMFKTDIPKDMLPHLADLALKAKSADITSVTFTPESGINVGFPNWKKIKRITQDAIAESEQAAQKPEVASTPSPASPPTSSPSENPSDAEKAKGEDKKPAKNIDEVCGF